MSKLVHVNRIEMIRIEELTPLKVIDSTSCRFENNILCRANYRLNHTISSNLIIDFDFSSCKVKTLFQTDKLFGHFFKKNSKNKTGPIHICLEGRAVFSKKNNLNYRFKKASTRCWIFSFSRSR